MATSALPPYEPPAGKQRSDLPKPGELLHLDLRQSPAAGNGDAVPSAAVQPHRTGTIRLVQVSTSDTSMLSSHQICGLMPASQAGTMWHCNQAMPHLDIAVVISEVTCAPIVIRTSQWNIERGYKLAAVIDELRTCDADVIALQEVDIGCERSGCEDTGANASLRIISWQQAGHGDITQISRPQMMPWCFCIALQSLMLQRP